MSDAFWTQLFGALISIGLGWMTYRLNLINKKSDQIGVMVNSNTGRQLNLTAIALRRLALATGDAEDDRAAKIAEELYQEHMKQQAIVDSKKLHDG